MSAGDGRASVPGGARAGLPGAARASLSGGFPRAVTEAPVLRGLDARALREIEDAGRLIEVPEGEVVYREGEASTSFFVVAAGEVALHAVRRGDAHASLLRTAGKGESFGEEATVGMGRRATATARVAATVAEIPVALFRRAAARSEGESAPFAPFAPFASPAQAGAAGVAGKLERALRHRATRDLFGTLAFTRDLPARDIDVLLDAARHRRAPRGEVIYRAGDAAEDLFLLAEGRVQIQTESEARLHVHGYLGPGDLFGERELLEGTARATSAVASGESHLVVIPAAVFQATVHAHPERALGLGRLNEEQREAQRAVVAPAAANATAHVFRDLYRLEVARSLLVIDLDACVRCGHCAWACAETHGTSRLVRRGDKMVARRDDGASAPALAGPSGAMTLAGLTPEVTTPAGAPQHLLLPNSCQHCENPACMAPCPTGAIGRDPGGEVWIREDLCTGCGACAKACPWDNIQMAARLAEASRPASPTGAEDFADVAVKCDLCRAYEGPACVQACPTAAISRINPAEALVDVRALLRGARPSTPGLEAPRASSSVSCARDARDVRDARGTRGTREDDARGAGSPFGLAGASIAAAGLALAAARMHARGALTPGHGAGLVFGALAAVAMLLLLAYAAPKRGVRRLMKLRGATNANANANANANDKETAAAPARRVTSVLRPHLEVHLALGVFAVGLALAHAPLARALSLGSASSPGGALAIALLLTSIAGAITALAYRLVPRRLTRIERTAALPEDFAEARQALSDRLFREVSGKSELVKKVVERVLLPYARRPLGPLFLVLSGKGLREEEQALRARIDAMLEGRGQERLAGLSELIRTVVEQRALGAQRGLLMLLRVGLPIHVVTFGVALALLGLHVVVVLVR
jgi:Fe-S-cluster-containing dehydrogenase component/CRP-like cAMP-binding protein